MVQSTIINVSPYHYYTVKAIFFLLWGSFSTEIHPLLTNANLFSNSQLFNTEWNTRYLQSTANSTTEIESNKNITCPVQEDGDEDAITSKSRIHPLQAFSKGKFARDAIKLVRQTDENYYSNVLNNLIMATCDVGTNATVDRCVEINSTEAAKDTNGSCIQASDSSCSPGYCERYSNCYWKPVVAGQPRQTRFPPEKYATAKEALLGRTKDSYIGGLLLPALVGILIALVLLLIWIVFIIARYCCCCLWEACGLCFLCSPIPRQKSYNTCLELITPMLVYALCIVVIVLCGFMSFIGNLDINTATIDVLHHSSQLLRDVKVSLVGTQTNLIELNTVAGDTAYQATNTFNTTGFVREDAANIVSSFTDYESTYSQGLSELSNSSGFYLATMGFSQQVEPVVGDIENVLSTLENDLYGKIDAIESYIDSAVDLTNSFVNETTKYESTLSLVQNTESVYRVPRQVAALAIFCLAFLVAFIGFLGLLPVVSRQFKCGVPCIAHTSWVCCAILGSIAILLASALLLLNMVVLDSCEMADLIIRDFEPFLGEAVAVGPNAFFHDTNLLVALDLMDKIDFPLELDAFLTTLEAVNMTEEFASVTEPLQDFDGTIQSILSTELMLLNNITNLDSEICPFRDTYTISNIRTPWVANSGKAARIYMLNSTSPAAQDGNWYRRASLNETGLEYMTRIYNIAGRCVLQDAGAIVNNPSGCCIQNSTTSTPVCSLQEGDWCTSGSACHNVCSSVTEAIIHGYVSVLNSEDLEKRMRSDLGVFCPDGHSCPTAQFQTLGHNSTIFKDVEAFQLQLTNLSDIMLNMTALSIKEGKDAVEGLICHMKFSFVDKRYHQLHNDICQTFFGGIAQLHWFMWILALVLEITAIIGSILIVRMKWHGEEEDKLYGFYKSNGKVRVRL